MSEGASITMSAVRRAVGMCDPGALVAVCCDAGRSFRKDLSPEYKATREEKPAAALAELEGVVDQLAADGYWVTFAKGFEADDVIATLTVAAVTAGHPVCIASADKDLLQLTALADVRQVRTHNNWDVWRAANVLEKFGVSPEHLGDWLALVGDSSDNIKGVPSVGPKTATALLNAHGTLVGIYDKIHALHVGMGTGGVPFIETKTPAAQAIGSPSVVEKLWKHEADAMLARKLVELRTDAPVDFAKIYEERKLVTKPIDAKFDDERIDSPKASDAGSSGSVPAKGTPAAGAEEAAPKKEQAATHAESAAPVNAPPVSGIVPPAPTEVAALVPVEYQHALEPRTASQAVTLGEVLYASRAFSRFPSAGAITATVMRGRELGIPALASLDAFHFAADMGRIMPSWQVIVTLAEQSPDCEWFRWIGGDDKSQTWETKHRKHPEPTRLTYKIEQAQRAGLCKEGKPLAAWNARPDEMLRKTCACQLARLAYPGATLGLYAPEEMESEQ